MNADSITPLSAGNNRRSLHDQLTALRSLVAVVRRDHRGDITPEIAHDLDQIDTLFARVVERARGR